MSIGIFFHFLHNIIVIVGYTLLGTVYFQGLIRRLDIPTKLKPAFKLGARMFFVFCAYTHLELLYHYKELPAEYFSFLHNLFGMLQAIGALAFGWILRGVLLDKDPLKLPKAKKDVE